MNFSGTNKRVLILQTWGMGDLIMMLPMLKVLKDKTSYELDLLVKNKGAYEFAKNIEYIDNVFFLRGNLFAYMELVIKLLIRQYDYCILGFGSGLKQIIFSFISTLFSKKIYVDNDMKKHRVICNINCLKSFLFKPEYNDDWRLNISKKISSLICIHPGSGKIQGSKKRPSSQLIRDLYSSLQIRYGGENILFIFGPDELDLLEKYRFGNCLVINTIKDAIKIISEAKLLITGDTGYGHIAAYVKTPVITLFGPTDIKRTMPYSDDTVIIGANDLLECIPCYGKLEYNLCKNNQCMKLIDVKTVVEQVVKLLNAGDPINKVDL